MKRSILIVVLLGTPSAPASTAPANGESHAVETLGALRQRVETLVAGAASPATAEEAARRLAALGPEALPDLLAALGHRRSDDPRRAALLGALDAHGRAAVLPHLASSAADQPGARAGSIVALGWVGEPRDLERMLALAADAGSREVHPAVHEALVQGSGLLWKRHVPTAESLRDALRSQSAEVAGALVQASSAAPPGTVLTAFENLLGRRPAVDRALVPRLPGLVRTAGRPLRPDSLVRLRVLLRDADDELARSAAVALAQLDDIDAVADLVGLLRHGEPRVADTARWALVQLTGVSYGAAPERWEAWYEEQATWYAQRAPQVLRMLSAKAPGQTAEALRELSSRPLFRRETAPAIAAVLERPEPELRLMGCTTLRHMRTEAASPLFVARLEDTDRRVVEVSHAALVELTGLKLPPDPARWREALGGEESAPASE